MEDQLRPLFGEKLEELLAFGDRDQGLPDVDRHRHAQLLGDVEEPALVVVDQDQPRRSEARQETAQLGADRTRGPGDEHGLARDLVASLRDLELPVRSPDEIVGRQLP